MTNQPNTQGNEPRARDDLVERLLDAVCLLEKHIGKAYRGTLELSRQRLSYELDLQVANDARDALKVLRTTTETNSEDAFVAGAKAGLEAAAQIPESVGHKTFAKQIRALDPTALRPSHMEGGK